MNEDDELRDFMSQQLEDGDRMNIYTTTGSTSGRYDQLFASDVPCLLVQLSTDRAAFNDRTQIMAARQLTFAHDLAMPVRAQILVNGFRWAVQNGTVRPVVGPNRSTVAQTCDVRSAQPVTS